MSSETSLTAHQRTATSFTFDLATGYPRVSGAGDLWISAQQRDRGEPKAPGNAKTRFVNASARTLGIPPGRLPDVKVIPSGSIGLDRTFRALVALSRARGYAGVHLLVLEPSVDIYRLMAAERNWHVSSIPSLGDDSSAVATRLLGSLADSPGDLMPVVLAASPANPTGWIFEGSDIQALGAALSETGGVLVLDHCFQTSGIHFGVRTVPSVWDDSLALECDWIGLWDTGKTLGLAGKKSGLIVPSSAVLSEALDDSIDVLQGEVDEGLLEDLANLVSAPSFDAYCAHLASICRENLGVLTRAVTPESDVWISSGGAFALLGTDSRAFGSPTLVGLAVSSGVSVAAGHHFETSAAGSGWIRLSLARDPSYFAEAVAALLGALGTTPKLLSSSALT